jgi:hypothetical protein
MTARHHLLISGTGRAGTTFLVQLLAALGLDIGTPSPIDAHAQAGLELDLRHPDAPYVVKSPWICDYLDALLCEPTDLVIDQVLIPVRDLYAAAESRRDVVRRAGPGARPDINGGLWHTAEPADQERVLALQLYRLIYACARHEIPVTLLAFPRLVQDATYLYGTLRPVLPGIDGAAFLRAFQAVCRPDLVHDFARESGDGSTLA